MSDTPAPQKRILVPVDGSDSANRACEYAIKLAKSSKAEILFIHVIDLPPITPYRFRLTPEILASIDDQANRLLSDCEERAKASGVTVERKILSHGDTARQILHACEKEGCDSIVIGKTGKGRVEKMLVGSIADKISKLATVPVIMVN